MNWKRLFQQICIIGSIILFISLFVDWYYYQVSYFSGDLVGSWSYNPITEWYSYVQSQNTEAFSPPLLEISPFINILFIGSIFASIFTVIFKDPEKEQDLEKLSPYAYINFLTIFLSLYYIAVFPVVHLFSNNLYFPVMHKIDALENQEFFYSIGPGYFLQCIGFILMFPYVLYYYKTIQKFYVSEHTPEKVIERYIDNIRQPLDLDRLIEEERIVSDGLNIEKTAMASLKSSLLEGEKVK